MILTTGIPCIPLETSDMHFFQINMFLRHIICSLFGWLFIFSWNILDVHMSETHLFHGALQSENTERIDSALLLHKNENTLSISETLVQMRQYNYFISLSKKDSGQMFQQKKNHAT